MYSRAVFRRRLEGVLARVIAAGWEFETGGIAEFECLTISTLQRVGKRVEGEVAGEGHGSDDIWGSDEGVGGRVGIVTTREVTVVRGDDCGQGVSPNLIKDPPRVRTRVDLALLDVLAIPLSNARPTSIGKDNTTDLLEYSDLAVTLDRGANLLGTRGNGELRLCREAMIRCLLRDGRAAGHVFVRRVGARADQSDLEFLWPIVLLDLLGELGDGGGKVGSEGTIDVWLKLREVLRAKSGMETNRTNMTHNLDDLVILSTLIWNKIMREPLGILGNLWALGSVEVVDHAGVEGEERGGSTNFGTHIANGSHTSAGERLDTRTSILNDGPGAALDGQNASDLQDDV
jgi:hypothetical protein